jgi:hypothetical protein
MVPTTLRLLFLLVAVLASGCAHRVAPRPVPPERVAALIAAALGEWERWGRVDVRVPAGSEFCAELPGGRCEAIEDGCGAEQDPRLCPVVNAYWAAVDDGSPGALRHSCTQLAHCEAHWQPEWGAPDATPAWSAAFISALMRQAGFDEREFAFSDTHAVYLVAARDGRRSAYAVVPTPATAEPGDLVCATRQAHPGDVAPTELADIRASAGATPMHCDLVVAVDLANGRLDAIGGNVQQAVARSRVTLDEQGRVNGQLNAARPWIAVMRLRKAPAN